MNNLAISMDSDPEEREDSAFMIVDITPDRKPVLVSRKPCRSFYRDFGKIGKNLVCSGNSGLDIYEIEKTAEITLLSEFKGYGGKKIVSASSGDLVFIMNEVQGVGIIDVADPRNPGLLSSICPANLSGELVLSDVILSGNSLLLLINDLSISGDRECILIYDISVPDKPQLRKEVGTAPCKGYVFASRGDALYIAGFNSFMVKNMISLEESGESVLKKRDRMIGVAFLVDGDSAYLVEHEWALRWDTAFLNIVDLRRPEEPEFQGKTLLAINFLSDNQDISMRKIGERLVLVSSFGLRVIDVSDPFDPCITDLFRPSNRFRITSGLEILTVD